MKAKLKVRNTDKVRFYRRGAGYLAEVYTKGGQAPRFFLIQNKEAIKALKYFDKNIIPVAGIGKQH